MKLDAALGRHSLERCQTAPLMLCAIYLAHAFLLSEITAVAVFAPLRKRDLFSSLASLIVDSIIPLAPPFGSLDYLPGQILGKFWMLMTTLTHLDCEADVVDWVLSPLSDGDKKASTKTAGRPEKHHKTLHKSMDCSLMDIADDIAYGIHDLEDALDRRRSHENLRALR